MIGMRRPADPFRNVTGETGRYKIVALDTQLPIFFSKVIQPIADAYSDRMLLGNSRHLDDHWRSTFEL